jgi:hypothetical protein
MPFMRTLLLTFVTCAGISSAQTPSVALQAGRVKTSAISKANIAVPTLGFFADPNGAGLQPIHGIPAAPVLGDVLTEPGGVTQMFLPPRQHYALVEKTSPECIAVWHLARPHQSAGKDVLDVIGGLTVHPDMVAFSPLGKSAALYSSIKGQIQVISGLPGKPVIEASLWLAPLRTIDTLLLSDDGHVVLAGSAGEMALSAEGAAFRMLGWNYSPKTMAFVSNSHNLLISDARQKQLVLLQNVDLPSTPPEVIGSALQPDHLASCAHGEAIVALDAVNQKMWQIDVNTLTVSPLSITQQADTLITLRDGHTLLLSTSPLYLMKIADPDGATGFADSAKQ